MLRTIALVLALACPAMAQPALSLGSVSTEPGQSIQLPISLAGTSPAGTQWRVSLPPGVSLLSQSAGPVLTGAGKELACNGTACLAYGINQTLMGSGTLAYLNLSVSNTASGNLQVALGSALGASSDGSEVPAITQDGVISILPPPPPAADATPPEIRITAPTGNSTLAKATITLQCSAIDNVAVTSVSWYVDGIPIGSSPTLPFSLNWNAGSVGNKGWHVLTAQASDAQGNSTTSAGVRFRVQ